MAQSLKILVIRFSSLGDLVLTTPVFREIKKLHPQSHLTLLTSHPLGRILDNNPHIDQVIHHPRQESWQELNQQVQSLKKLSFDVIYDIHRSLRSRWVCWRLKSFFSKKPQIWKINKNGLQRTLLIQWKINLLKHAPSQREIYLKPLQAQAAQNLEAHTELFPSEADQANVEALLKAHDLLAQPMICIGPSASFRGKCWPLKNYHALIASLLKQHYTVVLVGGKGEEEALQLKKSFGEQVHNMAGKLNFLESATLLGHASVVVSNDTSVAHMAEAMGVPVVVIFGPTVREFGYAPHLKKSVLVEHPLPCRPCTRTGKGECKIAQKRLCLTSISPQAVHEQIAAVIGSLSEK